MFMEYVYGLRNITGTPTADNNRSLFIKIAFVL